MCLGRAANVFDGFTPVYLRFTIGVEFRGRISGYMAVLLISGAGSLCMSALGVTGVRGGGGGGRRAPRSIAGGSGSCLGSVR